MKIFKILTLLLFVTHWLGATVQIHGLFTDHMVMQQQTKIPVWGWGTPGDKLTIITTWGKDAKVTVEADSTWRVYIKTPKAGGPYSMTVTGENSIVVSDIMMGEVWLCAGQSNMDFEMYRFLKNSKEKKYQPLVEEIRKEVATANDPLLRHVQVPATVSMYTKRSDIDARWRMAVKGDVDTITATGYYFAKRLREELDVPVGLIECAVGGTRIQPWLSEEVYMQDEHMREFFESNRTTLEARIIEMSKPDYVDTSYQNKRERWLNDKVNYARPWATELPTKSKQTPATLYNGMVAAIVPYTVKGVLWYQGESNSHFLEDEYEDYFRAMLTSWRSDWDDKDLPFYWTQLANYHQSDTRSINGWAMVNDHLRRCLDMKNTGMAVLCDIGETKDVHPHNKMDAGARLALWPLKHLYGVDIKEESGPLYKSHLIEDSHAIVTFSHVGDGLMVGNKHLNNPTEKVDAELAWFEIQDEDGVWHNADAKIISTNEIKVSNAKITQVVNVRYAWASNPIGVNLYNSEGLPAAVFSSEN